MNRDITGASDILETVSVLKSAKNLFFAVSLVCLALLAAIFVLSRLGMVNYPWQETYDNDVSCKASSCEKDVELPALAAVVAAEGQEQTQSEEAAQDTEALKDTDDESEDAAVDDEVKEDSQVLVDQDIIVQQAEDAVATVDNDPEEQEQQAAAEPGVGDSWQLSWRAASGLIKLCNTVLVFSLTLYSLTLLICVKITLVGRLGAAYYITSGMFFSMFAAVLFMPWQAAFPGVGLSGAMYLPYELACATMNYEKLSGTCAAMFYLRYAGLWAIVLLALIMAQGRSMLWAAKITNDTPNI
jgi:hypothetical protein